MHRHFLILLVSLLGYSGFALSPKNNPWILRSPDKNIEVTVHLKNAMLGYSVIYKKQAVVEFSQLGIIREDADFSENLVMNATSRVVAVQDEYEMVQGKKSHCVYLANEQRFQVSNGKGLLDIVFRVSNDGVAFRYFFPDKNSDAKKIQQEKTTFNFLGNTKAFLQPMSEAKTGWYENF
jgi:alpha-glucosidase